MRSSTAFPLRIAAAFVVGGLVVAAGERTAPRFHSDDPIALDDDTRVDASGVVRRRLGQYADFVLNSFRSPADLRPARAQNVNTLDEVPDSSWFTGRIGVRPMSAAEIARGPDRVDRLEVRRWVVVEAKDSGRQPGFRAVDAADPSRTVYQIEFDPPANPEMATGAEIIGTAIYHALGYNVVETYLIELDPAAVSIAPDATITSKGRTRAFTRRDLDAVLRRAAKGPDGRYRASASRFADGRNVGPFRYYGTRPDDPNDLYPHEHRRELRGNRVIAAWLNHDDSRAGNTLDMLVDSAGRRYVKHYMLDFGSMLGSGTGEADHPWAGHEYVVEPKPGLMTLATFGLWRRPFIAVDAPERLPAAGSFTADGFDPPAWKPHYPNAAFLNMRPDDAFWAARLVAAFTPEALAGVVEKARFSDPHVTDHVIGTLERRRALVLRAWLTAVNPLVAPRIDDYGILHFENAAETAGVAEPSSRYELTWFAFDNESGVRTAVGARERSGCCEAQVPPALEARAYIGVEVRTEHPGYPAWREPVRFYFRRAGTTWRPVGIERLPGNQH